MAALANSLRRIWSAKNRVPHQTRWGTAGSVEAGSTEATGTTEVGLVYEAVRDVLGLARRTAPTVFIIAYNLFR